MPGKILKGEDFTKKEDMPADMALQLFYGITGAYPRSDVDKMREEAARLNEKYEIREPLQLQQPSWPPKVGEDLMEKDYFDPKYMMTLLRVLRGVA